MSTWGLDFFNFVYVCFLNSQKFTAFPQLAISSATKATKHLLVDV